MRGCVNSQPHCKFKCTLYLATYSDQHTLPVQINTHSPQLGHSERSYNGTAHLLKRKGQNAFSVKLGMCGQLIRSTRRTNAFAYQAKYILKNAEVHNGLVLR